MFLLRLLLVVLLPLSFTQISYATDDDDPFLGEYSLIERPQKILDTHTVEVAELFLYTCPHCFHFEPVLKEWAKKYTSGVKVFQVPAVFGDSNIPLAKAFYTAEALNKVDTIHPALFAAIHETHEKIGSEAELQAFFVKQGVDAKAFTEAYNSFDVDSKVRQSRVLTQSYGISSVPNLVVNGKYRLSPGQTETIDQLLKAADFLIAKELKIVNKTAVGKTEPAQTETPSVATPKTEPQVVAPPAK
ncbi:MAG: thiol:disulfide interchange protein DsbA/DsbL [Thiotrichaceae bacterium]